jgi:acetylglutamate kinase
MQEIIQKAAVLIEALPYIQRFRGEIIVVKFGGSAMEDRAHMESVLTDIAFMECVGMRPVVVHGGGKAISRRMKEAGIEARFLKGLRVTCERTVQVVQEVMNQDINPELVRILARMGARARGVHGEDVFTVVRKTERDETRGETVDWGFVGEPIGVDTGPVRALLEENIVPVVTPLGRGPDGKVYNVNADTAAAVMAKGLKARKLAFLSDVPGLLSVTSDPQSLIPTVKTGEVEELVRRGIVDGGMLPKIRSSVEALHAGVRKVHLIDGRMLHSLLLEVFTDQGVGTEIVRDE